MQATQATDNTTRSGKPKLNNFSIGAPIDFERIKESMGDRDVVIGMLGNFLDIFDEHLGPLKNEMDANKDSESIKRHVADVK